MVSDEQWAGTFDFECTGADDHNYENCPKCTRMRERLVTLLARVRMDEAKWWHMQRGHHGANWCCERIDALKQAASKAAGERP